MRQATHALADSTKSLAIGTVDKGNVWHSGYASIFMQPEFSELAHSMSLFSLLDEARRVHELFFERMTGLSPIEVIFGEDLGWSDLDYIGVVGTRFNLRGRDCALGIVGSTRMHYPNVIPTLKYFRKLMQEIVGE